MKTKIKVLADAGKIWEEETQVLLPEEKDLEEEIRRQLTKGYVAFAEQGAEHAIEKGDRVTIRISGQTPRYNRDKVVITAGNRLYDPDVEQALIGMRTGESRALQVKTGTAEFTVTKTEKKVYPELTDEMVLAQKIEGVQTVEAYRRYYTEKKQYETAADIAGKILARMIRETEFDAIDAEDIRKISDMRYAKLYARFSGPDMDLDQISDEEWEKSFYSPGRRADYEKIYPEIAIILGSKSRKALYQELDSEAMDAIRTYLILCEISEEGEKIRADASLDPTLQLGAEKILSEQFIQQVKRKLAGKGR